MKKPKKTIFSSWFDAMDYRHGHTREAAESLGFAGSSGTRLKTGLMQTDTMSELAMAARRAGLEPWRPENDHEAEAARSTVDAIRRARAA